MSSENLIDLCSDNEMGDSDGKAGKKRQRYALGTSELEEDNKFGIKKLRGNNNNSSSNVVGISQSGSSVLEQGCGVDDESSPSFSPSLCPPPVCRQFWKAGNYEMEQTAKAPIQRGRNHLRVHPLFLHSNATSHKWAFGAIAELLDNAVDEIQNGATFVVMDKMINPRDGSTALLLQDDGGGMDPEAIRRCMSFGFSEKKDKCVIGQYGNGFKTSSMRLGADVIVFSRHQGNRTVSQSIGLLSYTFLRQSAQDRIVVPLVDYELNESSGKYEPVLAHGKAQFSSNMSVMLQWSPYSTEELLLKQFDDVGLHGTKIIVYNLWLNDDGEMELDFDSDVEDIRINADAKLFQAGEYANPILDQHIANLYRYSLRVYASILYRHLPQSFKIYLRGRVVEHHNIAYDLKFPEFVVYKPQSLGTSETAPLTTIIGFLKEAPDVNIHGFNIYHKNRLILPFWSVVKNRINSKARGVVGLLEANFIEPTHNKQDFEKTSLFQKLEARLKDMTMEYWDFHCGLIGYQQIKKNPSSPSVSSWKLLPPREKKTYVEQPVILNSNSSQGAKIKRKEGNHKVEIGPKKTKLGSFTTDTLLNEVQQPSINETHLNDEETTLMLENQKLRSLLLDLERREENLNLKVQQLRDDLGDAQREYARLLAELESTVTIKC